MNGSAKNGGLNGWPALCGTVRRAAVAAVLCGSVSSFAAEFPPDIGSFAHPVDRSTEVISFDYPIALTTEDIPAISVSAPAPAATPAPAGPVVPQRLSRTDLCNTVAFEAAANRLPFRFFANMIEQESSFNPRVVSPAGAQGIAQFMPGTAWERRLEDPFEPIQALNASAKFVAYLLARFGNLGLAAAAYNAGPQRVDDWLARRGGLPLETQNYVRLITGIPAEQWANPRADGEDIVLPQHADCPQLRMPSADPLVNTRIARTYIANAEGGRRRMSKYGWYRSRGSALTYVSLSASVAKSSPNEFTRGAYSSAGLSRRASLSR